jgi:hypothetical protein
MRRVLGCLGAAATIVVALTSCDPPDPTNYEGDSSAPRVALVGDSATALSSTELRDALGPYYNSVTGLSGYTVSDAMPWVEAAVQSQPAATVIELGGNNLPDLLPAGAPPSDAVGWDDWAEIYALLEAVRGQPCVVWVVLDSQDSVVWQRPDQTTVTFTDFRERLAALKFVITYIRDNFPELEASGLRIVDLRETDPDYRNHLFEDGIHPVGESAEMYAARVRSEVDTCVNGG